MSDLTERQEEVFVFILACWRSGWIPTYREIAAEVGITSPSGVICHLEALEKKGCIQRRGGQAIKIDSKYLFTSE